VTLTKAAIFNQSIHHSIIVPAIHKIHNHSSSQSPSMTPLSLCQDHDRCCSTVPMENHLRRTVAVAAAMSHIHTAAKRRNRPAGKKRKNKKNTGRENKDGKKRRKRRRCQLPIAAPPCPQPKILTTDAGNPTQFTAAPPCPCAAPFSAREPSLVAGVPLHRFTLPRAADAVEMPRSHRHHHKPKPPVFSLQLQQSPLLHDEEQKRK
jgi:hypothetical protein